MSLMFKFNTDTGHFTFSRLTESNDKANYQIFCLVHRTTTFKDPKQDINMF